MRLLLVLSFLASTVYAGIAEYYRDTPACFDEKAAQHSSSPDNGYQRGQCTQVTDINLYYEMKLNAISLKKKTFTVSRPAPLEA